MLVNEAVRGEGGCLLNVAGERFMQCYSSENLELDARDFVARANYSEIQAGSGAQNGAVFLDISHKDPDCVREHGVDITRESMKVAPTAYYATGGVAVDFGTGATNVEALFVAGVHGTIRLGGNSLA